MVKRFPHRGAIQRYDDLPLESDRGFSSEDQPRARRRYLRAACLALHRRAGERRSSARRRWTPADQRDRYPARRLVGARFRGAVSWQAVINAPVSRSIAVVWVAHRSGHPFTPVASAIATGDGYEPSGGRSIPAPAALPARPRSTRCSRSVPRVPCSSQLDNATNRANVLDYAYSPDYSTRRPIRGASPRTFYIGCSITR
jgi:hypothetical protein